MGSMSTARAYASATLLNDGTVFVAGGEGTYYLSSAETYDPVARTFGHTVSLLQERFDAIGIKLFDGRVLLAGGYGDNGVESGSEIYDPVAHTTKATASAMVGGGRWRAAGSYSQANLP